MKDKWETPDIVIEGDHVCYDFLDNDINLGMSGWEHMEHESAPKATIEEMYIACLIHETTHWAQTRMLSKEEAHKVERVYRRIGPQKALIERHAVEVEDDWLRKIGRLTKG